MRNYVKEIEDFITTYENGDIQVSDGVSYSMRDVNEESLRLYNGQFKSGKVEPSGFIRTFMRKAFVVYRTLIQGSDIDLKNMNIRSTNGVKVRFTALMRMAFMSHLERSMFGELMDKILAEMCWFGSSIVKRADGEVDTVDLRNYITETNIQDPQKRRHLEMCYYSYDKMQSHKEDWKDNWSEIENVWEEMQKENESQFKVLEFWTFDDEGKKICVKALDRTITEKNKANNPSDWTPYVQLDTFTTPYKKRRKSKRMREKLGEYELIFPYNQFDLFKVFGRQQAMGVGELLADISIVYNTVFNTTIKNVQKASLGVNVHTAIQGVNGLSELLQENISNLLEGGVISLAPGETLDTMKIDTRLQDFTAMEEKLYEIMRQLIGITAQGTGEEMPASTSATQASINHQVAQTVFDFTRERFHHGMKRLFNDGYDQDIWDEIDENELTAIIGDPTQLEELDKFLIDNAMYKWATSIKEATGMYPTQEEYDMNREQVHQELMAQGDMRFPAIKKKIANDMEYLISFDITQEAFDYKARYEALTRMKNDPNSTKSKAKIEDEILTLQGLNPRQYDLTPEEKQAKASEAMAAANPEAPIAAPAPLTI